ncbi:MAG: sugar phosphate nucleotidyltransferase, partial [Gammaproteobacteria bacterium]
MTRLVPVILAGGSGTRLWPMSREVYPKQFLSLSGEDSLLQQALLRLHSSDNPEITSPVIVCNEEYRFLVAEHAYRCGVNPAEIILEPEGRNTAPALTLAALRMIENDPVLLMMPADHLISDTDSFRALVAAGYALAIESSLVTFGVKPDKPETGYGYIRAGEIINRPECSARELMGFVEK